MTRHLSMFRRAIQGRLLYITSESRTYCSGVDANHLTVTDDGLVKRAERCECFRVQLQESVETPLGELIDGGAGGPGIVPDDFGDEIEGGRSEGL